MPQQDELRAEVVGRHTVTPDAAGILGAISRIGYGLPEAIADLVDNSVDAGSRAVLVRFFRRGDDLTAIAVADDGSGMDTDTIDEAMRFGSRTGHTATDLGRYGMGLKSASLNHARSLSVFTRQSSEVNGRRWTPASIEENWKLETLDPVDALRLLDRDWSPVDPQPSGTVVLWQDIDRFLTAPGRGPQRFGQYKRALAHHLGLIFHRFLTGGRLRIVVDLHELETETTGLPLDIQPLNPFPTRTGHRGYPATFHMTLEPHGRLDLSGHIWPALSAERGYKLNGRVAQHQGLYFFRNDRLIQAGGWNGWRNDAEPHASLARAAIDLPEAFDDAFAINVQKSGVYAPAGFTEALEGARAGTTKTADYLRTAIDVYRQAGAHKKPRPSISTGLTQTPRRRLNRLLTEAGGQTVPTSIQWVRLPEDRVFELGDSAGEIILNQRYRGTILNGARPGAGDAPLFKVLLFLLVADDLVRERRTRKAEERLTLLNQCLLVAVKEESRR